MIALKSVNTGRFVTKLFPDTSLFSRVVNSFTDLFVLFCFGFFCKELRIFAQNVFLLFAKTALSSHAFVLKGGWTSSPKRLLLRVEEHRTRHQNGIGKRENYR